MARIPDLEARLKENLDFFIKLGNEYYKPVLMEPYQLKVGMPVFTRGIGLSFPTIVKITEVESKLGILVGKSFRTDSEYSFSPSDIICAFSFVKPYGVFKVDACNKPKLIFASCSFLECCGVQEKWSEERDPISSFYVTTL